MPTNIKNALFFTIFNRDKCHCGNYRENSLLAISGKIIPQIIANHFTNISDVLRQSQCGFAVKMGTVYVISSAKQLHEERRE